MIKQLAPIPLAILALAVLSTATSAQRPPQPTEAHKLLEREVGVWDAKVKSRMMPGAPPMMSTAVETVEKLGDFWITSKFEGSFRRTPFTGIGHTGFDEESGEYVSTWIDSMAPNLLVTRGTHDSATDTLTLTGEGKDWIEGGPKQIKMVLKFIDADHKRFEIHEKTEDYPEWHTSLEIDYTRRK